ncbi:MAG: FAD-dependent oxidoreductase [Chloroflexi bacterium]|nr:FAD-dependent oxidoreductase [Chloroflexota bacterium]
MATAQGAKDLGTVVDADVLILGGGLAGIFAAMAAREQGRDALIVDKANPERSGEAGAGNDHFMCQLYTDPTWDTDVDMAEQLPRMRDGFLDPQVALNTVRYIPHTREILEGLGIKFHRDPATGGYLRTQAFAAKGPFWMMVESDSAKRLKPTLVEALRQRGVRILNRVMVTRLLVDSGQIVGATGFGVRTGEFYTFRAKAVVLTTGNVSRTHAEQTTHNPFNIWRSPFNTGDGHAMAWQAGIELEDMGMLGGTLLPKGFGAPGVAALVGLGAHLVNALGERYMFKYSPLGERAVRNMLVLGTFKEVQEGRGPCYFDMRHLPPDQIEFLRKDLLAVDRDTYDDFLVQKEIDPAKDPLEHEVGEIAKCYGGIKVSPNLETNIPRVFAAGQCAIADTFPGAVASGYLAGTNAANACQDVQIATPNEVEVAAERQRVFAPVHRQDGISPQKFEQMIRQVNESYVSIVRNETSLQAGLSSLRKLGRHVGELKADDLHELMRAHEAMNLLLCSELIALFSLERKESRNGAAFYRSDYPETDPNLHGTIVMRQVDGEIAKRFQPIDPQAFQKMREGQ